MRVLSFVLLLTLSYVSSASIESKICIQGGKVPEECPNNNKWNSVTCKFECAPHCVSNEGNFIFPDPTTGSAPFKQLCNGCGCQTGGTVGICTKMFCDPSKCYDDSGKHHEEGEIITSGCKTGTCTVVGGKGVWSWYTPASATTKPTCPFGPATFNTDTCRWDCPKTCQDGSTPTCVNSKQPCATVRCGFGAACVDNYCPNYPVSGVGKCSPSCKQPVLCTKNPCQSPAGQPKCGKNQVCEADYSVGCGYQCKDAPTCDFNGKTYQLQETRPHEDGCNVWTCTENDWQQTEKLCPKSTEEPKICIQGGKVPEECPDNNKWNPVTCQFECLPTEEPKICVQGGKVPDECPDNNQWNPVTCQFECLPKPTEEPKICIQGGKVPDECPKNNKWNTVTCQFECLPHCVSNEGNYFFDNQSFYNQCNKCTCGPNGISKCPKMGCGDNSQCWDDTGKAYKKGSTITRGCKTATCVKGDQGQGVWKWVNPAAQQPPRCDLSPATFDTKTCKWTCSKLCADGSTPRKCAQNPCAAMLCAANSQCVVNNCPNYPNENQKPCTASCQPIVNCFVSPCAVNSCAKGQTCVDDYVGGCNYRCKDKFRL